MQHLEYKVEREAGWVEDEPACFRSPYQAADWRRVWAKRNGCATDERLSLVFFGDGRRLAVLPLRLARIAGARVGLIDDGGTGNLNAPIVFDRAFLADISLSQTVLRAVLADAEPGIDLLFLDRMPCTLLGHGNPLLTLARPRRHRSPTLRGTVAPDFDAWERARLSGPARKLHRRRERQLAAYLGPLRLERAGDDRQLSLFLDAFDQQRTDAHRSRRVPHVFRDRRSREALREIARLGFGKPEGFRLYGLLAGDHVCAVSGILVEGSCHSGFVTAHDAGLRRFAPGKLLQHEVIRALAAEGLTAFDLGLGDDDYKSAWGERDWLADVALPITPRGEIAAAWLMARNGALAQAKSSAVGRALLARIRFLLA